MEVESVPQSPACPSSPSPSSPQFELFRPQRREFMRFVGVSSGLAMLGPLAGCGDSNAQSQSAADTLRDTLTRESGFWADVRARFVLDPNFTFMNVGTSGSMPREVLDHYSEENMAAAVSAAGGYGNLLEERTRVAPGLGADPDELVFSYNTSAGMCVSILGLDWQRGDVVVTTNHEHGGGNTPLNIARDRYGIEIERVALPTGDNQTPGQYQELFDNAVSALKANGRRVRAMMWSSPTYLTGTMLPIRELMEVVKKHELISIVDGAHLPGMMAYDYRELGVDFMSGAGHKWQCGPGSTGILYVRNKIRPSNPLPLPRFWPITSSSFSPAPPEWHNRAQGAEPTYNIANALQSLGSLNVPMFRSLTRACEIWDQIGRQKIQEYVLNLSLYLKERIVEKWGAESLYSPRHRDLLSALTSFNPFINPADVMTAKSGQFVTRLRDKGFIVRNTSTPVIGQATNHQPIRISTHLWHSAEDIDRLIDAMWTTAQEMR
ncbi:MAG: aminotransferase class V-fold PLP-dependent enzyme [Pigmentiphaga sp.]|uniref:aminotransferase class V-fold PLP-dependent enzyme n=1 Tax=Pigmentiphaga sp. TaxID=1977564 RepID=UPI0029B064A0|nr:aminotransferase class V-fold PLP-dependent enzyme [Pigmentiphaga sp.]MDX3907951.1 aminotransferase class V-fold PLP-dependent enzyme [Pigmentiphaga sp.]